MISSKSAVPSMAQAETLLIYAIFLLLTGLAQIGLTISYHYVREKSLRIDHFLPSRWTMVDIHLWYIYPSAALTLVPFLACVTYALFKRPLMTVLICISSLISFISSSIYVGLLIIHTLEYWQTISSYHYKSFVSTTTGSSRLFVPFDEPATFTNLALLITFTLALVQALLSMIGAVISCLWSPCCTPTWSNRYTPIISHSRYDNPHLATLRSIQHEHRCIAANGFLPKTLPKRCHV